MTGKNLTRGPRVARVIFRAHQELIQAELDQGWSALAIFERHREKLASISYRQFVRYANSLRRGKPRPEPSPPPAPEAVPPQPTEETSYARHQPPSPGRTFTHSGRLKEGDAERLLGPLAGKLGLK